MLNSPTQHDNITAKPRKDREMVGTERWREQRDGGKGGRRDKGRERERRGCHFQAQPILQTVLHKYDPADVAS